jgi:hypothetical protein
MGFASAIAEARQAGFEIHHRHRQPERREDSLEFP